MKILIFNQYFPPDRAATAQLLGQLAEDLSKTNDVTVVCGQPTYAPEQSGQKPENRMRIHRMPLLQFSRARLVVRLMNYVLFMLAACLRALTLPKHDVVICWTDPPLIGLAGVLTKGIHRTPFVFVSQDVYPEVARAMGKMNDPISQWILLRTSSVILKYADTVVAVGNDMRRRLLAKGCLENRIEVIPNWQDIEQLQPESGDHFRANHGISKDAFVVMHSGNVGFSQDFETLIGAAEILRNEPNIEFGIVGDGGYQNKLSDTLQRKNLSNVRLIPYQSAGNLADSLSAADIHYVSLKPELTGYIVPSKVYGILSVGKPIIANVGEGCDVKQIVQDAGCGILSRADPKQLASDIRMAAADLNLLKKYGESGRKWIEKNGGRARAIADYSNLIGKLRNIGSQVS